MGAGLVTGRSWLPHVEDGSTAVDKCILVHGPPNSRSGVSSLIYAMHDMIEAHTPKDIARLMKVMEHRMVMEPMGGVPTVGPNREIVEYERMRWLFFEMAKPQPDTRWCVVQSYVLGIDALIWVYGTPDFTRTPLEWEAQPEPTELHFKTGHPYHKHKETTKERLVREKREAAEAAKNHADEARVRKALAAEAEAVNAQAALAALPRAY